MTDWEMRARELLPDAIVPNYGGPDVNIGIGPREARKAALQLGHEMADAASNEMATKMLAREDESNREAADARAEEIRQRIAALVTEVRDEVLSKMSAEDARETTDERLQREAHANPWKACMDGPTLTREEVLEEALREIPKALREKARLERENSGLSEGASVECAALAIDGIVYRALEWKP